ncbi:hypothetical protein S83_055434, partial [Arachis hypogaea]
LTNTFLLPLTLGKVSPSDLLLNNSEVSGKHAQINWNVDKLRWDLVDMGSLNGTQLKSQPINNAKTGSRHWSDLVDLDNGDIITLGTTSKAIHIPFGMGMATDPMALRRGGKKLPMQDVCYYELSLPGLDQDIPFGMGMATDPMALRRGGRKLPMQDVCYYEWSLPGLDQHIPFGMGMATDPMALRRGGKKMPMQDVCYYEWSLPGLDQHIPFGMGMATDPMALRRGGRKLPMQDVCYYEWSLPRLDQHIPFGMVWQQIQWLCVEDLESCLCRMFAIMNVFGICDGHGGDRAAKSAS